MLPKLFFFSLFSSIFTHSYNTQCLEDQKSLLLQLKNELIFDSSISTKLVQWNETNDCCKWYGVDCDGAGHVISLQLDGEAISGRIGDSSTLFKIMYLEKLNLAYNAFNYGNPIPKGIHNLTYLTYLNLSHAGFGGQLPAEVSSLRRFVSLDISNIDRILKLEHPNLEMLLSNMTGLRELYLDGVIISSDDERTKWSHIISSYLPNLAALSLVDCSLSGPLAMSFGQLHSLSILRLDYNDLSTLVPDMLANFSSLTTLSLVECYLNGSFPNAIFHIPTLEYLDLSFNGRLSGSIPPFTQTGSLKSVGLRETNFSGLLPSSISNLKSLKEIDLSHSQFTGPIPSTIANLTQLIRVDLSSNLFTGSLSSTLFEGLSNLVYLNLESNSFSGNINLKSLLGLPSLLELHLSNNQFVGLVEESPLVHASNIVYIDLSDNRLEGPIPDSFFQLQSLETLFLFGNMFNGTFELDKILSLANLTRLGLSRNNLSVHVGNDNSGTYELPRLQVLGLSSCNLNDFPHFIKHSGMIDLIDLSDNQISGEIPSWIWGTQLRLLNLSHNLLTYLQKPFHFPDTLSELDLSSNHLRGEMHLPIPPASQLWFLSLTNNSLSGSITTSLCTATNLEILDLSLNKLSGSIPSCLLDHTMNLKVLDLGGNSISGRIPDNFPRNCMLDYFDLNNNTLDGELPKSLERCKSLQLMNVGNNIFNDSFPCVLSSSLGLRVLILRSNRFHGEVTCHTNWTMLQILDISSNNFRGSLESINLSSWRAMVHGTDESSYYTPGYYSLGSRVTLVMKGLEVQLGKIWQDFGTMDLSFNNFIGKIPNAIGDLRSLHHLNLSHNALNGSIPGSFGKLRELESLDLSQNSLTGAIPEELAKLTFLSVLNLSNNKLVGKIPNGRQLQTFSADSFKGNPRLCGFNLNISCGSPTDDLSHEKVEEEKREIEWEYVSAALGYVVGLGSIVWLLLFCRSFRKKYLDKIDEVVEDIFHARDMRRRRRASARLVRNQAVKRRCC